MAYTRSAHRSKRKALGISIAVFAPVVGTSPTTVSRFETGGARPREYILTAMFQGLDDLEKVREHYSAQRIPISMTDAAWLRAAIRRLKSATPDPSRPERLPESSAV